MKSESIKSFLGLKNIAVIGVSSKGKGFGVAVYNHLKDNGYNAFGVNKYGGFSDSIKLYNSISMIEQTIDGIITVVSPAETEIIVQESKELGIKHIWMQQGSESKNAIDFCNQIIVFIDGSTNWLVSIRDRNLLVKFLLECWSFGIMLFGNAPLFPNSITPLKIKQSLLCTFLSHS